MIANTPDSITMLVYSIVMLLAWVCFSADCAHAICSAQVETKTGPKACAMKTLSYSDPLMACRSDAELCAMWETQDLPGFVKCCAVFPDRETDSLMLATK